MMQPWQEANEEIVGQGDRAANFAKNAAYTGLSAASAFAGGGLISRVLPFLNKYIPENLVRKGLQKASPGLGKFVDTALGNGKSIDEVKEFIKQKIDSSEQPESKSPAKSKRNIIEQYDPELHTYLEGKIKKGKNPLVAGAQAMTHDRFSKVIKKIMKDHKAPWSDIVSSIYGTGETVQGQSEQAQPQQAQPQPGQQMQQGGQSQGSTRLMEALNRAQQLLGG
jgi:hypothetical protein